MQVIIMTSDLCSHTLPGFFHQWDKYFDDKNHVGIVVGFSKVEVPEKFRFISQGDQKDFPREKWSHRLTDVLDNIADEVFMLMLDDYWLKRQVDTKAIRMIYDYMFQFQNVLKFDLGWERLYAHGSSDYNKLGYLDVIKSDYNSQYHMSLWGGMWRRNLLKKFVKLGESAQQLETSGTPRLAEVKDEVLVLGTRQGPLQHANALQGREWNFDENVGVPSLSLRDQEEMKILGYNWA